MISRSTKKSVAPIGRQPMEPWKQERSSSDPGLRLKRTHPKSAQRKKCQNLKRRLRPARRLENLRNSNEQRIRKPAAEKLPRVFSYRPLKRSTKIEDEALVFALTRFFIRLAEQRGGMNCRKNLRRNFGFEDFAAVARHAK